MADNFGLKIGIEGEKEFKNSLRDINQSFKVLGSEMKSVLLMRCLITCLISERNYLIIFSIQGQQNIEV